MSVVETVLPPVEKFTDPDFTANGEKRASVALKQLRTLWINTGTLCNVTCANCYIESSPRNDRLAYIKAAEVAAYLDEIETGGYGTEEIGFTGGEPFMNPEFMVMVDDALSRGFRVLILTNAMRPMMKCTEPLLALKERFGAAMTLRVSVDHYTQDLHELERGARTWEPTLTGLVWLARNGFAMHVAGRTMWGEPDKSLRDGFRRLFADLDIPVDADDPAAMVLFPEMDLAAEVPEITEDCWGILDVDPVDMMCASSRMVVKRRGADRPAVIACTLLPYEPEFELGTTLAEASGSVKLNHPHCAKFCVLGGGSCSKA